MCASIPFEQSIENTQIVPTQLTFHQSDTPTEAPELSRISPSVTPAIATMTPENDYVQFPIPPSFFESDGKTLVFFGDKYKELPEAAYPTGNNVPDMIILHTDGQAEGSPENWNTETTYHGLGRYLSVHFAVSQDGILQMLPMYPDEVTNASGALPQYDQTGKKVTYNNHSIQIEMAGKGYNNLIARNASSKMIEVIQITTEKATDLVLSLMLFYDIPIESVVGHYQIGAGKVDPGNLYFEQYFLPLLKEKLEALNIKD